MGFAEGTEATLYIGKTSTKGTEPTTYETITFTSVGLQGDQDSFQDESIDPSGKGLDTFPHSLRGGGAVNFHWLPVIFDPSVETALRGDFSAAYSQTLTISFAAASGSLQTLTDDGATGVLGNLSKGDLVLIANASDTENNGLRRVVSSTSDTVTVYNPAGVVAAGDVGVTIDNNGVATLGKTASWQWIELVQSDGTNLIYSEWYKDCVIPNWSMQFPAGGATQCSFDYQGDDPLIVKADGSPPITKQRGGSDNAASTDRLVHGMDDVREVVLYSPTEGFVVLQDLHNQLNFQVGRQVQNHAAVGTDAIVNRGITRPTVSGQINAFLTDAAEQGADLVALRKSRPDDLTMHIIFGATEATSYGVFFDTVRITAAPAPPQPGGAPTTVNATFNAVDMRVTRI